MRLWRDAEERACNCANAAGRSRDDCEGRWIAGGARDTSAREVDGMSTAHYRAYLIREQADRLESICSRLYGACKCAFTAIEMQEKGAKMDWPAVKHTLYMALEDADSTDD